MPAFDQVQLRTPRLTLRPLRAGDEPALFEMFSDPEVMRYWSTPPWSSIEVAHQLVARDAQALATGQHLRLGCERSEDGRLIGQCTLFNLVASCHRAEIGYGMARSAWGHGYMGEALDALLRYGFENLDLNRVEADIDPRNTRSAQSLLRLGFKHEGHLRERWVVDGEVSDSDLYGLLHREWVARA